MKKIVIIGANDFQRPLIQKAHNMGYETHVFAWREGATGAEDADHFYEISITEKEEILEICRKIRPDAVATIGSDLANITVQFLAEKLGLPGNSSSCIYHSTNKYAMREAFRNAGIPVPFFQCVSEGEQVTPPSYPVIVKPTDRSGSRAITKVNDPGELAEAITLATAQSFEKKAIVEEYISGAEYSVETISFEGKHTCLAITKKFTTGSPHYIEVAHLQPAPLSEDMKKKVEETVFRALDALEVRYGAGHSELRIDRNGQIRIIEIGSRMGGDCIGSDLVPLSTGQDFVGMVVDTAAGKAPVFCEAVPHVSAIRFLMNENDEKLLAYLQENHPDKIRKTVIEHGVKDAHIVDSGSRPGFFILQADSIEEMMELLHHGPWENPIHVFDTPTQKLRFTENHNEFYMKRDDLLPFAFGGNKVRFARRFVEDMQRERCDSMIIYGNYHSNLCRILATLCHELEIPCYMVHNTEDVREDRETANSRIIKKMGITEIACKKSGIADAVEQAMEELREKGYRPYYIYGNSRGQGKEWVPMKAYEAVYDEICCYEKQHSIRFDYIFLASSTNATQSGLLAGSLRQMDERRIIGISVSRNAQRGREVIAENLREYAQRFQRELPVDFEKNICFTDAYMEGGYGVWSEPVADLIESVYGTDGIPLDMTYTGKAFYGMVKYLEENHIQDRKILFLHTGGTPLFFDFLEDEKNKKL
ncbi:pyridoxal-phosphate dependent enzyme [Blautia sp. MSJ-19]|uniref:pyridoxal-phosphate dependent enzyme n=1 Tax=Blautia sp. MSJ-19 TaxID=2841517 RepID=UPI001C0ED1EE|nr:pyridoxal-phosphate dependent enzyme [Blautia sp. MSJ-19]MBU5481055.1 pyridoxal-phosphate dependent enzyme [Blautia sp. MSJ-19]